MSGSDWFVFLGIVQAKIAVGTWSASRVWKGTGDPSEPVRWAIGKSGRAGFQERLSFRSCWVLAGVGVVMWVGFSVRLFMRPRFAVPPRLRDQPGWLVGIWRSLRSR